MFSKALIATDISPASDRVVEYTRNLRPLGCREVILLHVIYVKHTVGLSDALKAEAAPRLAEQKRALETEGFSVSVATPVGVPGPEINRQAVETGCRLIIIGSHGHTAARDIALGGVAMDVTHRAQLPVLLVRLQILGEECQPCCQVVSADVISHVLYATDFSDNAERAFQYVEEFAGSGCKTMTLMHVQDMSRIGRHMEGRLREFNEIDRSRLERMALRLRALGVEDIHLEIPYGSPAKEIVRYVRDACPSVVVMGMHGRGFISDIFAGSVSHNVVRLAQSPVLLIPSGH